MVMDIENFGNKLRYTSGFTFSEDGQEVDVRIVTNRVAQTVEIITGEEEPFRSTSNPEEAYSFTIKVKDSATGRWDHFRRVVAHTVKSGDKWVAFKGRIQGDYLF